MVYSNFENLNDNIKKVDNIILDYYNEFYKPSKETKSKVLNTEKPFFKLNNEDLLYLTSRIGDSNGSITNIHCTITGETKNLDNIFRKFQKEDPNVGHLDTLHYAVGGFLVFDQQTPFFREISKHIENNGIKKVFLIGRDPVHFTPTKSIKKEVIGYSTTPIASIFRGHISEFPISSKPKNFEELSESIDRRVRSRGKKYFLDVDEPTPNLVDLVEKADKIRKEAKNHPILLLDSAYAGSHPLLFKKLACDLGGIEDRIHTGMFVTTYTDRKYHSCWARDDGDGVSRDLFDNPPKPIGGYYKLDYPICALSGIPMGSKERKLYYKKIIEEQNELYDKYKKAKRVGDKNYYYTRIDDLLKPHIMLSSFAVGIKSAQIAHEKNDLSAGLEYFKENIKHPIIIEKNINKLGREVKDMFDKIYK
jgi:hypothetical protein